MPDPVRRKIAIVGAGAGGIMLASALAKPGPVQFDVTLVDRSPARGQAFGAAPGLMLNTRAGAMSLDPCSPAGFVDWLNTYRPRPEGWSAEPGGAVAEAGETGLEIVAEEPAGGEVLGAPPFRTRPASSIG